MAYKKEDRYRLTAQLKDGTVKTVFPMSVEQKNLQLDICRANGFKVLECVKLYPFNTGKNQHNFMLISNICSNKIRDMENGEIPWSDNLLDILEKKKERADYFFCLALPVAWIPYTEYMEARELVICAVEHRVNACVEHGRLDLIQYC